MIQRSIVLIAAVFSVIAPHGSSAQGHQHVQPTWARDMGVAGANMAAGGITAAVTAAIKGEDVPRAFLQGAVGGGVMFLGKRIAVERFAGAGLLGRELASVGSSVVVNGGGGRGWLDQVWLPVGPVWLQVSPRSERRARVNLHDVGLLAWAIGRSELEFDWSRSLSNGAMVFVSPNHLLTSDGQFAAGFATSGLIALGFATIDLDVVQSHENVHVIQNDFLLQAVSRPLERWGWGWITDRAVPVDFDLLGLIAVPGLGDLKESEAQVLEVR